MLVKFVSNCKERKYTEGTWTYDAKEKVSQDFRWNSGKITQQRNKLLKKV
jgi:hypothetical protein